MNGLLATDDHFAFRGNWKSFSRILDGSRMAEEETRTRRPFPDDELKGTKLLDIGCSSELSTVVAGRLAATFVAGDDIDRDSVEATSQLLVRALPT